MYVQFMVADGERYLSPMPHKVIETYRQPEYPYAGYEVYEVKAENVRDIRVYDEDQDCVYVPSKAVYCGTMGRRETTFYVTEWEYERG